MMKRIFAYFAKKYALSIVNDGIAALQEKRDLKPYKEKAMKIAEFTTRLLLFLDDNKIDQDELEKLQDAAKGIF